MDCKQRKLFDMFRDVLQPLQQYGDIDECTFFFRIYLLSRIKCVAGSCENEK